MGTYDRDWYRDACRERQTAGTQRHRRPRRPGRQESAWLWKSAAVLSAGVCGFLFGQWAWENAPSFLAAIDPPDINRNVLRQVAIPSISIRRERTLTSPPRLLYEPEEGMRRDERTAELTIFPNQYGNFFTPGTINGEDVMFIVDTGASYVSIPDRLRWRLKLERGRCMRISTATEVAGTYATHIDQLTIGPIHLSNIFGDLRPKAPNDNILLGMSALRNLEASHSDNKLILRQRSTWTHSAQPNRPSVPTPAPQFKRHLSECIRPDRTVDARVVACMEGR